MNSQQPQDSMIQESKDPLISFLTKIIIVCVKFLAVMMVLVVIWAVIDVAIYMFQQFAAPKVSTFSVDGLIDLLGAFLAVLIAIEVFLNIVFYLKKDAIHVPLVLGTALTAVARKVIVLDYTIAQPHHIYAIAASILAVGITYWLVTKKTE